MIYIISDCHGNIDGLLRAMVSKRLIDKHGNRQLARRHQIISIGDIANCVSDSLQGDFECLNLIGNVIDKMIIGNHEMPYLDSSNYFAGFSHKTELQHKINSLLNQELIGAAFLVGNTLISHAGISQHFCHFGFDGAERYFNEIKEHWKAKDWNYSLFSSVGYARGGNHSVGGILWCDFDNEFIPTSFPQICGHTPGNVRIKGNALCIDVGAKDQETEPFILEIA